MKRIIRTFLKEQEEDQYYKITPQEYLDLMKLSGYHENVTKIKKFGGKPLWITGNVDLSNTPIESLGNVARIDGRLDISRTKIKDISGIEVKGHIWDSGTPRERIRLAAELRQKREEAQERRETGEWDLDIADDEGLKANALYQWLVNQGDIEELSDEEKEELRNLKEISTNLTKEYDECEEDCDELYDKVNEVDRRIEELEENMNDVYVISPLKYKNYGIDTFEVIGVPGLMNREYCVGTEEEMDEAVLDYTKSYVDDVGIESFSPHFLEQHIDDDYFREFVYDFYEDDIWNNPEVYFSDDDYELTEEQKERIEDLEGYIEELDEYIDRIKSEQEDLEGEIEDPDEYSERYDELQEMIDEAETKKETAQDEIDSTEPETEPTQEMVDRVLEDRVDDAMSDQINFIKMHGLDISNFLDTDGLAETLDQEEGYGIMNSYDGTYDLIDINGESYYIMRVN